MQQLRDKIRPSGREGARGRWHKGVEGREMHTRSLEADLGQELWVKAAAVEKCQEALGTVPLTAAE